MNNDVKRHGRREVLGLMAIATAMASGILRVEAQPVAKIFRSPTCGCCHLWAEHLRRNGFAATIIDTDDMRAVKARLAVPAELASCHTAEIEGYVVEGHVPAHAIRRLLAEKPKARGLAIPGMPIGSPGMEGGTPEIYEVILFGEGVTRSFGRYRESAPL
ncbi:MAG: DUF411 domain-containing protein [Hyphomicrobiaceae bacterium]